MPTSEVIGYRVLRDVSYRVFCVALDALRDSCLHDGTARWLTLPAEVVCSAQESDSGLHVWVQLEASSSSILEAAPWVVARAYSYAVYTGAVEQLRRDARMDSRGRYLPCGASAAAVATLGGLRFAARIDIEEE